MPVENGLHQGILTEAKGYGSKMLGRLKHAYDKSSLALSEGPMDGQRLSYDAVHSFLPRVPYSVSESPVELAAYNKIVTEMTAKMVAPGLYIDGIGGMDFKNLPTIVGNEAKRRIEGQESGMALRVVYGATKETPLRALSYIIPALCYMENMQRGGLSLPQLQIIFPYHISARLNRMAIGIAREEAEKLAIVARDYVDEFFPQLAEKVIFMDDGGASFLAEKELEFIAGLSSDKATREDVGILALKGEVHGGIDTYLLYAAAHVLIHDTAGDGILRPMFGAQSGPIDHRVIVSFGGKSERIFYRLRHAVKPHLGQEYNQIPTLQFFTRHSNAPYYMAKEGDLSLFGGLSDPGSRLKPISTAAAFDLEYLEESVNGRGYHMPTFSEFLTKEGEKLKAMGLLEPRYFIVSEHFIRSEGRNFAVIKNNEERYGPASWGGQDSIIQEIDGENPGKYYRCTMEHGIPVGPLESID